MASPFAITKNEVSASLFVVTETWFDNYRDLMSRVEKDALAGQPEKVALVSALCFVKDTSSLAKDHLPVKSVNAFLGSPKFGIPLFVIDFAAKAYEAHWKNLEARANAQKGAMYTTIFVDYLQKLTDIENRITSFPWYQSILDQAHGYLSKCDFSSITWRPNASRLHARNSLFGDKEDGPGRCAEKIPKWIQLFGQVSQIGMENCPE